jgi:hypothetical protein
LNSGNGTAKVLLFPFFSKFGIGGEGILKKMSIKKIFFGFFLFAAHWLGPELGTPEVNNL